MRTSHDELADVEKILARHRLILEQLRVHLEGLAPATVDAAEARRRMAETIQIIGALEARQYGAMHRPKVETIH